jgi:germination protein M
MKTTNFLVVLAMVLAACSGNGADSPTTTTQPTTTTSAPTTTTTTGPETTTTTLAAYSDPVTVYVLDESGSNGFRQGPFLYPIAAAPRGGVDEIEATLGALVAVTEFDTSIPAGTTVDSVSVDGTVARVDLSDEFASGGGSASMFARLAQLTFTMTALDGIDSVLLVEDGTPVEVFSSEGIVLDGPMVRDDFEDLVPGILVDSPAAGATVELPFDITGIAAAFEGVFQMQILEGNEVVFEPDFVSTSTGIGWGSFDVAADLEASPGTTLIIRVWENSARDGSVISERFVPVVVAG